MNGYACKSTCPVTCCQGKAALFGAFPPLLKSKSSKYQHIAPLSPPLLFALSLRKGTWSTFPLPPNCSNGNREGTGL